MIQNLFTGQKYNPLEDKRSRKSFELKNCELTLRKEYTSSTIQTANVIGMIEGSDPVLKNEYITLCAHLDHMGIPNGEVMNGADDNASGSAGVLEIAEALAVSKPERSIICLLFAGEEIYFQGSYYFTKNPPVPIEHIVANVNLDMIGCSDTDVKGLAPMGAGRITPKLREIISEVSERTQYVPIDWAYADTDRYVNMSDHYPFHLKNIPAVFFFSGDNADIHLPTDDAEKIDYEFFQKSCQLVYEIVMELANRNVSPRD
jgi:Zn-dependent M28 family amino/carboxypeptidase